MLLIQNSTKFSEEEKQQKKKQLLTQINERLQNTLINYLKKYFDVDNLPEYVVLMIQQLELLKKDDRVKSKKKLIKDY